MQLAEIQVSYKNPSSENFKVTSSQLVYELVMAQWNLNLIEFQEEFKVILLNQANVVLGIYEMSRGGTSGTVVDVKIILSVGLKCHASGIILVHNHPSGNLKASEADIHITQKLKRACEYMDMKLLDHLIITKNTYLSFGDDGLL